MFIPFLMMLSGLTFAIALPLSQLDPVRFDSYRLFVESRQLLSLALTYLTFLIPFLTGALAIGLVFLRYAESIGTLYAANLLGSSLGGIVALGAMWLAPVHELAAPSAFLPMLAGVLLLPERRRMLGLAACVLLLAPCALVPWSPRPSEYKSLSRTLSLPDARVTLEHPSPLGFVHVVSSPSLRHAPGLSLTYRGSIPSHDVVFNNGDWFGPLVQWQRGESVELMEYSTMDLPYTLTPRRRVLVLQARTGLFVAQALHHDASNVTAVEAHRTIVDLLCTVLARATDSLFLHPRVQSVVLDARSFLMQDSSRYDLIVLPTLDAFGGTSGVYALQEQYLLTKEAFGEMWERLTPGGVLCLSSWLDHPVRNPARALATIAEMLSDASVVAPAHHIAAIRNWGMITFVVKRTPLTRDDVERVQNFCERMQFDPLLLPGSATYERNKHNVLSDPTLFRLLDGQLGNQREDMYATYDFRIAPPTDDRPYFSQFLRWKSLARLRELFGQQSLPFLELGSFIIFLTFMQIAVLSVVLILLPLTKVKAAQVPRRGVLLYFGAVGLGYMFVEMVLIQRFVLIFGQPLYATATVIGAMLLFSGVGSAVSARIACTVGQLRRRTLVVSLLIVLSMLLINTAVRQSIMMPSEWKFVLAVLMIAPLGFLMGMPFPLGVRALAVNRNEAIPWAWGINGCASVIAAPLATILAIEVGFTLVMIGAAVLYVLGALAAARVVILK
jgi:spermidine synthase